MNFSFVFIGSTHSFLDDFSKQEEIINLIKPEFVLSEELENLKLDSKDKFLEFFKTMNVSNMTSFEEVEKLARLCFNRKIKLIGIDFHNFGFDEELQRKIKNREELSKEDENKLNKIIRLREKHHLSKILEYRRKTSLPIVVILGCWHLREGSLLREKLKNYKIIAPLGGDGEVLFAPSKNKDVKYGEMISDDYKVKN